MPSALKFLVVASLASSLSACAADEGGTRVPMAVSGSDAQAQCDAESVVVAVSSQRQHAWQVEEIRARVDAVLEAEVNPWQATLVSPMLPDFEGEEVVVFTLGETGTLLDEYRAMKGFGVRVDLQSGAARVTPWGVPRRSGQAYERVIPRAFASEAARRRQSDQALLDLMTGAREPSALTHAFTHAADWFDAHPVYTEQLATKMSASIDWLRDARAGELAR